MIDLTPNIYNYEHAYYGDSYARLQKLKGALDPENRFSYKQSIAPRSDYTADLH